MYNNLHFPVVTVSTLQLLTQWRLSCWSTWLPPWLAEWSRWAGLIWLGPHEQLALSDVSTRLPKLLARCCFPPPKSAPSSCSSPAPLLTVARHYQGSVRVFPASSRLQGWKPSLRWSGAAKTVSLSDGGDVYLCSVRQIQGTSRGRAKMCLVAVYIKKVSAAIIHCLCEKCFFLCTFVLFNAYQQGIQTLLM